VAWADGGSFLGQFHLISTLASTVPANGDLNPYGVAVVPRSMGRLVQGNVLVSNFNNAANLQGTGTSIVQISPSGTMRLFAQINPAMLPGPCPGGVGLTTALVVLNSGWVIVGSLPTTDGTPATAQAGCLLVLNSLGTVVETMAGPLINGPWDMTALDQSDTATLFVSNVLNGTVAGGGHVVNMGTVVRLTLSISSQRMPRLVTSRIIGSGFPERTDPAALVIGPTGLGLGSTNGGHDAQGGEDRTDDRGNGTLYVADSLDNRIAAIPNALTRLSSAGTGLTVSANGALNDPLGLAIAPNGDVLTANGNDGNAVETTPSGAQIAVKTLDAQTGAGALFGLAVVPGSSGRDDGQNGGVYFVDDGTNTLNLLH
jgi:hypothetical protein